MAKLDDQKRAQEAAARQKPELAPLDRELTEAELDSVAAAGAAAKKFAPTD